MIKYINITKIREDAEMLYAEGSFYCSEAIVSSIRKHISPDMPEEAISIASGFPVGIGGTKCVCGAVSGGVICLGYFFGRTNPKDNRVNKAMALSKELCNYFKANNKSLCCNALTSKMEMGSTSHINQCVRLTGEIAEKTALIIARELHIKTIF